MTAESCAKTKVDSSASSSLDECDDVINCLRDDVMYDASICKIIGIAKKKH